MTSEMDKSKRSPNAEEVGEGVRALMRLDSSLLDLYLGGSFEVHVMPDEGNSTSRLTIVRNGKELYTFAMRWRKTDPFDGLDL